MATATANPVNVTGIDHVVFRVHDLAKMLEFYRDVIGCRLERGPGDLQLAQLRAGRSLIDLVPVDSELGRAGGAPPAHEAPSVDHVCLQVAPWDERAIIEHLDRHGVDYGGVAQRYGARGVGPSIYLHDPEGNQIELKG